MWVSNYDYRCDCGSVLLNTCSSAIKNHKKTNKHKKLMSGEIIIREKKEIPKTRFYKKNIVIIWD